LACAGAVRVLGGVGGSTVVGFSHAAPVQP
jgi:hypothetical protein